VKVSAGTLNWDDSCACTLQSLYPGGMSNRYPMNRVLYGSQSPSECSREVSVVGNGTTVLTLSWPVVQGRFKTNALYAAALVPTVLGPRKAWLYFRYWVRNILYVNSYTVLSALSIEV
jgi:hypothetical protein